MTLFETMLAGGRHPGHVSLRPISRLLRIFATVVDGKGFAAAPTELNLSAPSISRYIAALEWRLGVRPCTRGRGGFAVTDKGAIIYREAQCLSVRRLPKLL